MTDMNLKGFAKADAGMRSCADLLLVASSAQLAAVEGGAGAQAFPGLLTYASSADEPVPADLLAAARVVVVEVDPGSPASLDRLRAIGRDYPDLPRIAAIAETTIALVQTLVREGVSDVIVLPLQIEELLDVTLRALAHSRARSGAVRLAPQLAVVRSIGGCGATSIATHVAAHLAAIRPHAAPVALVDLDLQAGSIAEFLGTSGTGTLSDLLAAGSRLDEELLRAVARKADDHLVVFASPDDIQPLEAVDTDRLLQLLTLIRQNYSAVVVDVPTDWTNWAVSVLSASDLILMVVELNVKSLRQAKRRLDLLAQIGVERDRVVLVINRAERRMFKAIDTSDVSETLHREVIGTVSLEGQDLASAQAQGVLAHRLSRKSKFSADVAAIAEAVAKRIGYEAR
ncbi:AAA family ATPase [Novosphingobium sp. NPDC080210]|uniref:AAA family ATPase n=1 Tax=Novosphingobium sp. NPDC080210 TaxID=3390596 RepID=UPI003D079D1E